MRTSSQHISKIAKWWQGAKDTVVPLAGLIRELIYIKTLIPNSYSRQLFYSKNGVTVSTHSSDTGICYFIFNEYGQVLNILAYNFRISSFRDDWPLFIASLIIVYINAM